MSLKLKIASLAILMILAGIFTFIPFRALPSIGIIVLTLSSVGLFYKRESLKNTSFLIPSGIFFLIAANAIINPTDNTASLVHHLTLKLPFLILGISFMFLPSLSLKQLLNFYYFFFLITLITAAGTLVNFFLHFEEILQSYKASKIMPTPVSHVRYSLIIAFSIFTGIYLWYKKHIYRYNFEKYIIAGGTIFLFVFLHILSVRSGIAAFYLVLIIAIIVVALKKKWYWQGASAGLLILLIPVASYFLVPTFRNKIENTLEDFGKIGNTADANNYSLAGRVVSYKVASTIIEENMLIGIGAANLETEVKKVYKSRFPEIHEEGLGYLMPHNQFLVILASTGISGLLVFLFCFYYPLIYRKNYRFPLLLIHYIIITVSFLFEGTLETQTGSVFTVIFLFLPLSYLKTADHREII